MRCNFITQAKSVAISVWCARISFMSSFMFDDNCIQFICLMILLYSSVLRPFQQNHPIYPQLEFGGPRGRVDKVADFSALNHSIISPLWVRASLGARFTCGTSQVLLAGVSGGFSPGTPVFAPPTDRFVSK